MRCLDVESLTMTLTLTLAMAMALTMAMAMAGALRATLAVGCWRWLRTLAVGDDVDVGDGDFGSLVIIP